MPSTTRVDFQPAPPKPAKPSRARRWQRSANGWGFNDYGDVLFFALVMTVGLAILLATVALLGWGVYSAYKTWGVLANFGLIPVAVFLALAAYAAWGLKYKEDSVDREYYS